MLHKPHLWGVSMATRRENIVTRAFDWLARYASPGFTAQQGVSGIPTVLIVSGTYFAAHYQVIVH